MNKTILFAGYDFEQKEYRGTSFYARSVLKAAKELGCSNYLLTGAPFDAVNYLQELLITRNLDNPASMRHSRLRSRLAKFLLSHHQYQKIPRGMIEPHTSKLNFLHYTDGYINRELLYKLIRFYAQYLSLPFHLQIPDFDIIFCTTPLNIKVRKDTFLVQTLHDIAPLIRAEHPPDDDAKQFYHRIRAMLKYANAVVSVSDFSKQELLRLFPQYCDKIITTYQPVPIYPEESAIASDPDIQLSTLRKYGLESQGYLLFIGVLEKRKNLERLIEAFLIIKDRVKMPLVLIGSRGYGSRELKPFLMNSDHHGIRYLGYVPTIDKLVLLKNATAFVFPSLYEGFGLPPLEAMQMGCPVLTSNTSALPEVCQKAALYVDPRSISSIAEGMLEIVNNATLRSTLIEQGHERAQYFSYDNYKDRLSKVIDLI